MKHTMKAKYAADGLAAHRQRLTAQPAVAKAMKERATLDQITARLTARPDDFASVRKVALDNLKNWFAGGFEKQLLAQLTALQPGGHVRLHTGQRANALILDDLIQDDLVDATSYAFAYFGKRAPAVGSDFGVIKIAATC